MNVPLEIAIASVAAATLPGICLWLRERHLRFIAQERLRFAIEATEADARLLERETKALELIREAPCGKGVTIGLAEQPAGKGRRSSSSVPA